jgi:hypothetical protein
MSRTRRNVKDKLKSHNWWPGCLRFDKCHSGKSEKFVLETIIPYKCKCNYCRKYIGQNNRADISKREQFRELRDI